ncbi:CDP-diacylglycerol--glycerol-3-phosphate 3-phosphatidyltransferase [Candidatus Peregrinibacteria bacterium CG10_big_fil_rev_8_21_14_0_10_49_24]|nr:MAG: CDP-diacylglycerol--glycerol-3-phosphate 3-phosphatidyltransferase [Candidatus Peregrinibacteria bacterium CG11_big_fil_rev_8_21_14_0_20_49_14]PIR50898.1 MAG: CDP-diacylglycerol--glycerol-3-phosphate 3-phosphatidyltransferase [Candidatus Peregrinibacteria bacterium CG10_big_fil_rev_8_21_14_0_10_49_24]PJA67175.1 MAG: CDP-diacylglycerol--glycerol-3-phosphate 3-phosphatidyltransferase [Candidatus Peregrinibacteria bacterium CG_4_9_14_3_um_filter_49_12]
MTLPNKITLFRFVLAAGAVSLLLLEGIPHRFVWAFALFVLASFSDYIDGILARRMRATSELGAFMDPLADKMLILLVFAVLMTMGLYPLWLFVCILARDLLNDSYRNFAASQRVILGTNPSGKAKTLLQMISISVMLLVLVQWHEIPAIFSAEVSLLLLQLANLMMFVALVVGAAGTVQFISKHSRIITGNE